MYKVGILTFHRSRNYGAVLQTYALTRQLRKLGIDAEVIDYQCEAIEDILKLWNGTDHGIIFAIKQFIFRLRKKLSFESFIRKHISVSKKKNITKNQVKDICAQYTAIIVGSDQVWNGKLTDNDSTYFLEDIANHIDKYGYAVSVGDGLIDLTSKELEAVKQFESVSVRESNLKNYLEQHNINVSLCCDPSLFISQSKLLSLASKRFKKKYVFLFMIEESDDLKRIAGKFAKEHDCELISNKQCIPFFFRCSPTDFLSWICHAEYVFTNSFHGTVFSIRYHKRFLTDIRRMEMDRNERVYGLLSELNLLQCVMNPDCVNPEFPIIQYNEVDKKIKRLSKQSIRWLNSNIRKG